MQNEVNAFIGLNSFKKKIIYIVIFFVAAPITLFVSIFSLYVFKEPDNSVFGATDEKGYDNRAVHIYAALPNNTPEISAELETQDARPEIIRQYLEKYDSPMTDQSDNIVRIADKYDVDYRLTTAIAMKESGLGKRMPHEDCNNAWGYGIHSEGTLCFDTWEKGIETVTKGIKENYLDLGYDTPEEMMRKYTPLSKGTWAEGVVYYMSQLQ